MSVMGVRMDGRVWVDIVSGWVTLDEEDRRASNGRGGRKDRNRTQRVI